MTELISAGMAELDAFPRVSLGHLPTPLELMPRLSEHLGEAEIYIKRDDCTGLVLGGNKVRQLEFYLGDAIASGCDTVLSTGAVQSNYMRTLAAAANKLGLECHIQFEDRVANDSQAYQTSGNRFLTELLGATIYRYPEGEDEYGADRAINAIAEKLEALGKKSYIVPLAPTLKPRGALGYVVAANEMLVQFKQQRFQPDVIVVPSGSGLTHAGTLFGLKLFGANIPVLGVCVRRRAAIQQERISAHCINLANMLGIRNPVSVSDIWMTERTLAPGYGQMSEQVKGVITLAGKLEGVLVDPVYSGKTLAALIDEYRQGGLSDYKKIVFVHTGGAPALFAYQTAFE